MRRRLVDHSDGHPVPPELLHAPDYEGLDPHPDPGAVFDAWREARARWADRHGWPGGAEARWQEESDAISRIPHQVFCRGSI